MTVHWLGWEQGEVGHGRRKLEEGKEWDKGEEEELWEKAEGQHWPKGGGHLLQSLVFLHQGCPPTLNCGRPSRGRGSSQRRQVSSWVIALGYLRKWKSRHSQKWEANLVWRQGWGRTHITGAWNLGALPHSLRHPGRETKSSLWWNWTNQPPDSPFSTLEIIFKFSRTLKIIICNKFLLYKMLMDLVCGIWQVQEWFSPPYLKPRITF